MCIMSHIPGHTGVNNIFSEVDPHNRAVHQKYCNSSSTNTAGWTEVFEKLKKGNKTIGTIGS